MGKEIISRRNFLKFCGLTAAGLALNSSFEGNPGSSAPDTRIEEAESEICPERLPVGCRVISQEGFKLKPGGEERQLGETVCIASPDLDEPREVRMDRWTMGEKGEDGRIYQANCQLLCTRQPPFRELEKICGELRLPNGTAIYSFEELNIDEGLNYQVNDVALTSLLAENKIDCEEIKLVFFFIRDAIIIPTEEGDILAIGTLTPKANGSKWITVSEFDEPYEGQEHDHRTFNQLSGLDRVNWIALHEVAEGIESLKGLDLGDKKELWCDEFADEHYLQYRVIQGGEN